MHGMSASVFQHLYAARSRARRDPVLRKDSWTGCAHERLKHRTRPRRVAGMRGAELFTLVVCAAPTATAGFMPLILSHDAE